MAHGVIAEFMTERSGSSPLIQSTGERGRIQMGVESPYQL